MTRQEAVNIIGHYDVNFYYISGEHEGEKIPSDKLMDAFEMAMDALDVIDEIEKLCNTEIASITENWMNYHSPSEAKSGFKKVLNRLRGVKEDD